MCKAPIQPFKTRESPRPWQANSRQRIVTGLLNCVSLECQTTLGGRERLWNRDLVATMNFLAILRGHRNGEGRPGYLARELVPMLYGNNSVNIRDLQVKSVGFVVVASCITGIYYGLFH